MGFASRCDDFAEGCLQFLVLQAGYNIYIGVTTWGRAIDLLVQVVLSGEYRRPPVVTVHSRHIPELLPNRSDAS